MKGFRFIIISSFMTLGLYACNGTAEHKQAAGTDSISQPVAAGQQSPVDARDSWINDFRDFQSAIAKDDLGKQKTYFDFPLNADTTQIWEAVYYRMAENERPAAFPHTFTEQDFEKNHKALFNDDFTRSIAKLNAEDLLKKGESAGSKVRDSKGEFSMTAHVNTSTKMLQLTLSYPGGTDEEGNYVSEGEYAVIYFFKIISNKHLKFDKVLFAG